MRNTPETHKYMHTAEGVQKLLKGILEFFDSSHNPEARSLPSAERGFHCDRNYTIEITKVDSACRIGEVFAFKVDDYQIQCRLPYPTH